MGKIQRLTLADVEQGASVAIWDLETVSLNASFGYILCSGIASLDATKKKHVEVVRIDEEYPNEHERWRDYRIVEKAIKALNKYEYVVTYNGLWFDAPFLTSRALEGGASFMLSSLKHVDLYRFNRNRLRLGNRSLAGLISHLQCKHSKTPLSPLVWRKAGVGVKSALDDVVRHNIADVLSLAEVTRKLLKFTGLPFVYLK